MAVKFSTGRSKQEAFTLIELLVVIAIIGVLTGVLFPVLQASRRKARQTTCLNNLHQIGLALNLYVSDYNTAPPRFQNLWESGLIPNRETLRCPEDRSGNRGGNLYDALERSNPSLPPETIHYSYHYALPTTQMGSKRDLAQGVMVCQLHGQTLNPNAFTAPPDITDFEGFVLRLQWDGAVVQRNIRWERLNAGGVPTIRAREWQLFSDSPPPGQP